MRPLSEEATARIRASLLTTGPPAPLRRPWSFGALFVIADAAAVVAVLFCLIARPGPAAVGHRDAAPAVHRRGRWQREALRSYLAGRPSAPRTAEASVMLAWLLLDAGDLSEAVARFEAGAAVADPEVVRSARAGLAVAAKLRARTPDPAR
jgi:hypothetical protein